MLPIKKNTVYIHFKMNIINFNNYYKTIYICSNCLNIEFVIWALVIIPSRKIQYFFFLFKYYVIESDRMKCCTHASYQSSERLRNVLFVERHMFVIALGSWSLCFEEHTALHSVNTRSGSAVKQRQMTGGKPSQIFPLCSTKSNKPVRKHPCLWERSLPS